MNSLHQYIQQGIQLSNDTVAIESLATALSINPSGANSRANTLINVATESFCNRWGIPRVVIATESFQTSAAKQASIVACEGVKEMAANAWRKFIEWLRGLIAKFKAKFEKNKVRNSILKVRAKKLTEEFEAIEDFHTVTVEGNWPTLVCDGKVSIGATQHFTKAVENDSKVIAKELTAYLNASLKGESSDFKPSLYAAKTNKNVKAYGVSNATVYTLPNNMYMAIGLSGIKPQLDFFPGESTPEVKTKVTVSNQTSVLATIQYINEAVEFLENQDVEYKAFIDLIEQLTKSTELPFKKQFDTEDSKNYYTSAIRAAITCGSDYIQQTDRIVLSSVTGLMSYVEEILKVLKA